MSKVFIVGADYGIWVMYLKRGWEVVNNTATADLIQFTGGSDVTPSYYNEPAHPTTSNSPERDAYEAEVFLQELGKKPFAGICRGGQFLNVMSGGKMWQDVNSHALRGTHVATIFDGRKVQVTSTHHQMMDPKGNYELLLYANLSTIKERGDGTRVVEGEIDLDVESVFYPETNALCYQPHPEYVDRDHPCQELYFELIQKQFNL